MKRLLTSCFVFLIFIMLVGTVECLVSVFAQAEYPACVTMDRLEGTNGSSWRQGAVVTVIINPTDFPPNSTQRQKIEDAFLRWQNANTNSGVTFTFTSGSQPPTGSSAINTHYVGRQPGTTPATTNISNTGTPFTEGNITISAVTSIDSSITNSAALYNVMLHEIGHTFGLAHCVECAQGSSIMTAFNNDCFCPSFPCDHDVPFNGVRFGCPPLSGPRDCDENAVNNYAAYPSTTPTPAPTPTPCAEENNSCTFAGDCCPGLTCGEITGRCIPCDLDPHGLKGGCVSEACANCYAQGGTYCEPDTNSCWTPILIDVKGDGFRMTGLNNGIRFDGFGNGVRIQTAWTLKDSDDAWLVLDRNSNGLVDDGTELFSSAAPQPALPFPELKNGFNALAQFDKPERGGNADGTIDINDHIFSSLRLWQDFNHNGISELSELNSLPALGVAMISLDYKEARRKDRYGNTYRYRAKVTDERGIQLGRWACDVFPLALP